jgi:hypothetical protein
LNESRLATLENISSNSTETPIESQIFTTTSLGRSAIVQGAYQMATVAVTIAIALVGGVITGLLLRLPIIEQIEEEDEMFDDEANWITPEDFSLKLTEVSIQNQPTEEEEIPLKIQNQ